MCSRPFETRSRPHILAATLATLPSMSLFPKAPFDLSVLPIYVARVPAAPFTRLLPSSLYLDHSHCPVLVPATLAALPSTRAIPDRDVFYVAHPARSIETRSLPTLARCFPRSFTFYVAHPIRSIRKRRKSGQI